MLLALAELLVVCAWGWMALRASPLPTSAIEELYAAPAAGLAAVGLLAALVGPLTGTGVGLSAAILIAAALSVAAVMQIPPLRRRVLGQSGGERRALRRPPDLELLVLAVAGALWAWLLLHHLMAPQPDGALASTGDTWGDLAFHAGAVSSFAYGQNLPPQWPFYSGHPLGYPYFIDLLSGHWLALGAGWQGALVLPAWPLGVGAVGLLMRLAARLGGGAGAGASAVLVALGGGAVVWGRAAADLSHSSSPLDFLLHLPADYTGQGGIAVWPNPLVAFWLPERPFLLALPLGLLAVCGVMELLGSAALYPARAWMATGVLVGLMGTLHPHSALALGLTGVGLLILTGARRLGWTVLGAAACLPLALVMLGPGMLAASSGIRLQPGWLAKTTPWPLFWLLDAGLPIALGLMSLRVLPRPGRMLVMATAVPFLVANLVVFQPWDWDNAKILIWPLTILSVAGGVTLAWMLSYARRELRRRVEVGLPLAFAAALALVFSILPGGLALAYEQEQSSTLFSAADQTFAAAVMRLTPPRAVVLAADVAPQPVSCLAGRPTVLGYPGWIWSHGLPVDQREADLHRMFGGDARASALLRAYQVRYVAVGPAERASMHVNLAWLARMPRIYDVAGYQLYRVIP